EEALQLLLDEQASGGEEASDGEEEALLAMACHSLGMQQDRLGLLNDAAATFRQAAELAARALGPRSPLAIACATRFRKTLDK
ncbi:unnamed protein product, partial [Polarella glacialis]